MEDHLTFEEQLKQHQAAAKPRSSRNVTVWPLQVLLSSLHTSMDRAMTE